mmetsp:Transcript_13657/g.17806  ORF Transcript_13657/g.17806 Transcript_13657/m.17806 type:complete len:156 (+) Transcript_13657:148-615(+)
MLRRIQPFLSRGNRRAAARTDEDDDNNIDILPSLTTTTARAASIQEGMATSLGILEEATSEEEDYRTRRRAHRREQGLLIMAQNHMLAFLIFMYLIYVICRYGFGWKPGDPPPRPIILRLNWKADNVGGFLIIEEKTEQHGKQEDDKILSLLDLE